MPRTGVRVMILDGLILVAAGVLIALWLDFKSHKGDDNDEV